MTQCRPLRPITAPLVAALVLLASTAVAYQPGDEPAELEPEVRLRPSPYSLPWQLRPALAGNAARLDTSYAMFDVKSPAGDASGNTLASMLLFSYKVTDSLAPLVRLGYVTTQVDESERVSAFINPVLGATYGMPLGDHLKLGLFLGVALPLGQGGGDRGDASSDKSKQYAAAGSGIYARAAMDNAMFAVNYLTFFPGVGLAYVADGLTVQGEVTVLSLNRARGGDAVEADTIRWNLTSGVHVGYFVLDVLSLGAEFRYQRWLSTPKFVEADESAPAESQRGLRDQATLAVGPRFHLALAPGVWLRPGIAYSRGLDKPMSGANVGPTNYNILQFDVPLTF